MNDFLTYNEFDEWYRAELKAAVPDYDKLPPEVIHRSLTPLTQDEADDLIKQMLPLVKLHGKITYVYNPSGYTFASWFNPDKKRVEIIFPTIAKYMIYYKPLIIVGIQHELGHIMNKDCYTSHPEGHNQCINICMDIRINATLDHDLFDQIVRTIYGIGSESDRKLGDGVIRPETTLPEMGLAPNSSLVYDWRALHNLWHTMKGEGGGLSALGGFDAIDLPPEAQKGGGGQPPQWVSIEGQPCIIIYNGKYKGDFGQVEKEIKTDKGIVYRINNDTKKEIQTWFGDSFCTEGDYVEFNNAGTKDEGSVIGITPTSVDIQTKKGVVTVKPVDIIRLAVEQQPPPPPGGGGAGMPQPPQMKNRANVKPQSKGGSGGQDDPNKDAKKQDVPEGGQGDKEEQQQGGESGEPQDGQPQEGGQQGGEPKPGEGQKAGQSDPQSGQGDKKGQQPAGESGEQKDGSGKEGEKSPQGADGKKDGESGDKSGEQKSGEGSGKEGEESGEGKSGSGQEGDKKDGEDGKSGEGKPGESEGKDGEGKPSEDGKDGAEKAKPVEGEGGKPGETGTAQTDDEKRIAQKIQDKKTLDKIEKTITGLNNIKALPQTTPKQKGFIDKKVKEIIEIRDEIKSGR